MNRMESVALSAAVLAVAGALIAALWRAVGVLTRNFDHPAPVAEVVRIKWTDQDFADLSHRIDHLQEAVAEGITKVTRNENRIAKTVTAARRLVREAGLEHPGIEAEHEELFPADDDRIEALPPMPEQVEGIRQIRIPGGNLNMREA